MCVCVCVWVCVSQVLFVGEAVQVFINDGKRRMLGGGGEVRGGGGGGAGECPAVILSFL